MPEKLTDSEIVKILETSIRVAVANENSVCMISKIYAKEILDLINRLQAENERLKNELYLEKYTDVAKRTIKAEAYKECIEKVKSELKNIAKIDWQNNYYYLVGTAFFDNLLKEMVGEDNA